MKKIFACAFASLILFSACANSNDSDNANANVSDSVGESSSVSSSNHDVSISQSGDLVEISENLFIAQTNDIYINTSDYIGKTVKYEGIFLTQYWEDNGETYFYVIRYGPGCCGYDENAGFEVIWDDESQTDYPEDDSWVEAVGILESYEEDGYEYLRLRLSSLNVLEERGEEYVYT